MICTSASNRVSENTLHWNGRHHNHFIQMPIACNNKDNLIHRSVPDSDPITTQLCIPVMDSLSRLAHVLQEHEPDGDDGGEQRRGDLLHGVAYPRHLPGGVLGRHGEQRRAQDRHGSLVGDHQP